MTGADQACLIGRQTTTVSKDDVVEQAKQDTEIALGKAEAASSTLDARVYEVIGAEDVELQLQERERRMAQ